jgi:hypothetical protein
MPAAAGRLLRNVRVSDLVGGVADPTYQQTPVALPIPADMIAELPASFGPGSHTPRGVKVTFAWTDGAFAPVADSGTMSLQLLEIVSMPYGDGVPRSEPWGSTVVPLVAARDACEFALPAGLFTVVVSAVAPDGAEYFSIFWETY